MRLLVALLLFVMTSVGGICVLQVLRPYASHSALLGLTLFILTCVCIVAGIWLLCSLLSTPDDDQHTRRKGGRGSSSGTSDGFDGGFGDGGSCGDGGCGGGGDGGGGGGD